jgi:hypothetical protein
MKFNLPITKKRPRKILKHLYNVYTPKTRGITVRTIPNFKFLLKPLGQLVALTIQFFYSTRLYPHPCFSWGVAWS